MAKSYLVFYLKKEGLALKNLYLIARDTESTEAGKEHDELNLYTQNKYPHFKEIPYQDGEKKWTHSSF